jgi:hypothetical protein
MSRPKQQSESARMAAQSAADYRRDAQRRRKRASDCRVALARLQNRDSSYAWWISHCETANNLMAERADEMAVMFDGISRDIEERHLASRASEKGGGRG